MRISDQTLQLQSPQLALMGASGMGLFDALVGKERGERCSAVAVAKAVSRTLTNACESGDYFGSVWKVRSIPSAASTVNFCLPLTSALTGRSR